MSSLAHEGTFLMAKGTIAIDQDRCKGCGLCGLACPQELIAIADSQLNANGFHPAILLDPDSTCTGCAICAVICPDVCITVYRELSTKRASRTVA
jgi:2-oxoglutarate ferredoxin oxidoreductase subunit delta